MGGQPYFNAGTTLTSNYNRGLLRFDFSQIPAGSKITSVQLTLEVVLQGTDMPASSNFQLHRLLRSWGEGTNTSGLQGAGRGAGATSTNAATWLHRFALTTNLWSAPGGQATNDYVASPSADQFIYDVNSSPYTFGSTAQLVADVQAWVDKPQTNFGWLLKTEDETVTSTARRFGAREDLANAPRLDISYIAAPLLSSVQFTNNQLTFAFDGEAGRAYTVESTTALGPAISWAAVTNIPALAADSRIIVSNSVVSSLRFFRVTSP